MRVIISIILMVIAALVGFFFGAGMNEAMGGAILLSMITGFACTINAIEKNKKDCQLQVCKTDGIKKCKAGSISLRLFKLKQIEVNNGQKTIDIRPHTRYNIDNLIRKQCYHYCYRWNGSHIYEKIIGTEWLNPQGDNVSDLTAKTIFLR